MQSSSQARAKNLQARLDRLGVSHVLTRAGDGLTRVWLIDGRRLSTKDAERYCEDLERKGS